MTEETIRAAILRWQKELWRQRAICDLQKFLMVAYIIVQLQAKLK
jgi:hypothetical protein